MGWGNGKCKTISLGQLQPLKGEIGGIFSVSFSEFSFGRKQTYLVKVLEGDCTRFRAWLPGVADNLQFLGGVHTYPEELLNL